LLGEGCVGGLLLAAGLAEPASVAHIERLGTGIHRVAMLDEAADRLNLPLQWSSDADSSASRYCVSVDAVRGTTTGISARDRAATLRILADPAATHRDLTRPGHVVPLRVDGAARTGYRYEHAAIELSRLAGITPAVAFCEVASRDGRDVADDDELVMLAEILDLAITSVPEVASRRSRSLDTVDRPA
jgi:3,4-dihydroxy 2-butanone 4-phosphate synthase/GTP cyclohydrolase II